MELEYRAELGADGCEKARKGWGWGSHMRLRGWNPILGQGWLGDPSGAVSQAVRVEAEAAGSQESGRVWVPGISANQLC